MKTIEEKLGQGREYRNLKEFRADEDFVVTGYASTFNEPYTLYTDGDYTIREQVAPTAFDDCDMSDVIMQYDHTGRVFARISNNTLEISTDDHGLKVNANLGGTEIGRGLYEEIAGGYTTKMSFGFIVDADERLVTEDGDKVDVLRTITRISKLFDVSAVSLPANDGTAISARSIGEGVIEDAKKEIQALHEKRERIERIKAKLGE